MRVCDKYVSGNKAKCCHPQQILKPLNNEHHIHKVQC